MQLTANNRTIDLTYPHVMGILNVTPDSFSDGGDHNDLEKAIRHADKMVQEGATFIDVGGESTRPNANEVSVDEELDRVIPVIEKLAHYFDVWISVDTSKPEVITAAASAGADLINDVRSLREEGALAAAVKTELPVCLMHMVGTPKTMLSLTNYQNPIQQEIDFFFAEQIDRCIQAGIPKDKLLLDPGFGFGKTIQDNYRLLEHLDEFHHFELPLLVGMSRKSMIGQLLNVPPKERIYGNVACAVIAAMKNAKIIRVHDVKATNEALKIVQATQNTR